MRLYSCGDRFLWPLCAGLILAASGQMDSYINGLHPSPLAKATAVTANSTPHSKHTEIPLPQVSDGLQRLAV